MDINITTDIKKVMDGLASNFAKQVPFATSLALNKTIVLIKKDLTNEIAKSFNNPLPKLVSTAIVLSEPSTKTNLVVGLRLRNKFDGGIPAERILAPHITGGVRKDKPSEMKLKRTGRAFLLGSQQTIVGKYFKNNYGDLSGQELVKIMSVMGANTDPSTRTPTGKRPKGRLKSTDYFSTAIRNKKNKHLEVGIYKRTGDTIAPVLLFTKGKAKYPKRLRFYEVGQKSFDKNFQAQFAQAFEYALKTARP